MDLHKPQHLSLAGMNLKCAPAAAEPKEQKDVHTHSQNNSCITTFLLGIGAATLWFVSRNREPRLIVPNAAWEPFLFKTIDERTAESGLPRLRTFA
jgi:hypothetical protein